MATKDDLFNSALNLSPEERVELAQKLLESVDDRPPSSEQRAVEEAWDLELERRVLELREGRVKSIAVADVRRNTQALLERLRRERTS